jgi:hypothetical protein
MRSRLVAAQCGDNHQHERLDRGARPRTMLDTTLKRLWLPLDGTSVCLTCSRTR